MNRRLITKTGFSSLTRTAMRIMEQGLIIGTTNLIYNCVGETGKVRVPQEELVDLRKLLARPPAARVRMYRSELTRAHSDSRMDH